MTSSGSTMGYNDICDRGTLDSPLHDQLKILNDRMIEKSEKMKEIIKRLKQSRKLVNWVRPRGTIQKTDKNMNLIFYDVTHMNIFI